MKVLKYFLFGFSALLVLSLVLSGIVFIAIVVPFYIFDNYGMYYGIFVGGFIWSAILGLLCYLQEISEK